MRKKEGKISFMIPFYILLFLLIIIKCVSERQVLEIIREDAEDALAASNLASAVIDIQEYGITHNIVITDPEEAFDIYKDALKVNMGLDEEWESTYMSAISGQVMIREYIIYNVRGSDIEIYHFGDNEYQETKAGGLGTVKAPNGRLIESTSVYSKIAFPIDISFGIHIDAEQDKLVDIVNG